MRQQALLWSAALLLFSSQPQAAALARAEAVQSPVWLERAGVKSALAAGTAVQNGDLFITGKGARLHLAMADGSVVKLGENGQLRVPILELTPLADDADGLLFSSALKVIKGAFRFTARALGKVGRREVVVSIGNTVTAGIRGTDIWGKSDPEQDLICLLEGRIEVSSPDQEPQIMDEANTFYVVPRDAAPLPIAPAPPEKLEQWVPQTELNPSAATLTADGGYMVGLESHDNTEAALAAVEKFAELGYATEITRAKLGDTTWYRVVITGLATDQEARAFAAQLQQTLKLNSPWVLSPPKM